MSAAPSLLPAAAAVVFTGLMAIAPDARSASVQANGWYGGGDRDQYNLWIRGDNANDYGWYKKDKKKKGPRSGPVIVAEPPMIVLLGTGLLVLGFVAWRMSSSRKSSS
jgi:hypothetical protein